MSPVAYTASNHPSKPRTKTPTMRAPPPSIDKQAALEDLTRRVRDQSDRLQRALSPYAERIKTFAEDHPVVFTYASVFVGLSSIPVTCTVLFVLSVSALFTGIALFLLCSCIIGVIVLSMTFLVPVLVVTATLSAMAVGFLLALFLTHRLYLHIRAASEHANGLGAIITGAQSWADETLARVGLGSTDFGPTFDGRSVDSTPHSRKSDTDKDKEHKYYNDKGFGAHHSRPVRDGYSQQDLKALTPPLKSEPRDVRDVFSPQSEAGELHQTGSGMFDGDWVSEDDARDAPGERGQAL